MNNNKAVKDLVGIVENCVVIPDVLQMSDAVRHIYSLAMQLGLVGELNESLPAPIKEGIQEACQVYIEQVDKDAMNADADGLVRVKDVMLLINSKGILSRESAYGTMSHAFQMLSQSMTERIDAFVLDHVFSGITVESVQRFMAEVSGYAPIPIASLKGNLSLDDRTIFRYLRIMSREDDGLVKDLVSSVKGTLNPRAAIYVCQDRQAGVVQERIKEIMRRERGAVAAQAIATGPSVDAGNKEKSIHPTSPSRYGLVKVGRDAGYVVYSVNGWQLSTHADYIVKDINNRLASLNPFYDETFVGRVLGSGEFSFKDGEDGVEMKGKDLIRLVQTLDKSYCVLEKRDELMAAAEISGVRTFNAAIKAIRTSEDSDGLIDNIGGKGHDTVLVYATGREPELIDRLKATQVVVASPPS